jgi:hypothetical protein
MHRDVLDMRELTDADLDGVAGGCCEQPLQRRLSSRSVPSYPAYPYLERSEQPMPLESPQPTCY